MAFWNEMMAHHTRDDFWKPRNIRPHLKNIQPAVMTVGGWYDAENLVGALETYRAVETLSSKARNAIVMGPWVHGGWARQSADSLGDVWFGANTAEHYQKEIEFPFFKAHLKGDGAPALPEASMFETGANRWHELPAWPPAGTTARTFYFGPGGTLQPRPPASDAAGEYDEYVSDPKKPVPSTHDVAPGMPQRYMVDDQRHAARRPDVLVYETGPLAEDLTIAGPIEVSLNVSTTGTDTDWIVKLIDVYPDGYTDARAPRPSVVMDGYQQLVRGDVMRGKFRNSLEQPEPFTPGAVTAVAWELMDVFHTFRKGHRVMVQVHSTWFPLIDINPGKFLNVYEAGEADFQKTTQRVYRSRPQPSSIQVQVMR